jgi:hypothetical protein
MTDEHLDRLVRDADPYRSEVIGRLDGAEQILLEEIVSQPNTQRRGFARRTVAALAAAAVVTTVFAASAALRERSDDVRVNPVVPSTTAPADTVLVYSAAVLQAAEKTPRLLIGEPGWKVTTVYGFSKKDGAIQFENEGRKLEMNWYPAKQYDRYHKDRLGVSAPERVKVDGRAGDLFTYSASDFAVMLTPRDGTFVELRTGEAWTRQTFDQVLTVIKHVDVRTWLAALPSSIVTPGRVEDAAKKVLADVPLPPGLDLSVLEDGGSNDPYQFGAKVTGLVGCGWVAEWKRAKQAKDEDAAGKASAALSSSRNWKVLNDMNAEGDWPEVFWDVADKIADDDLPRGFEKGIGC